MERPELHRSPEENLEYHRDIARKTGRRRNMVYAKLVRWFRRNRPDLLETYRREALRKVPRRRDLNK